MHNCACFLGLNAILATTLLCVVEVSLLTSLKGLLCHGQFKIKQLKLLPRVKLVSRKAWKLEVNKRVGGEKCK